MTAINALKRKYDTLQHHSAEVDHLLSQLKSVAQSDARRIIDFLREGNDIATVLQFARALPATGAPAEQLFSAFRGQNHADRSLTAVPYGGYSSSASVALDLNAGRYRPDIVSSVASHLDTIPSRIQLPSFNDMIASVEGSGRSWMSRNAGLRRSPSAPNLHQTMSLGSKTSDPSHIWHWDDRLRVATARDWGITYVDDLNYSHIDPGTATAVHKAAWTEAERAWESDIDDDDDIALAAAGMMIWALHSFNGTDKLGLPYLLRTRHIGAKMGLYDKKLAAHVYDHSQPQRSRARAIHAWGLYNWVTMAEFAFLSDLGYPHPPPVPMPRVVTDPSTDQWTPWPWPRTGRTVGFLKDETGSARASLSCVIRDIVPMRRQFSSTAPTMSYLQVALGIYERLLEWWNSVHPDFRSSSAMEEAPPHVFMVGCLYNFAIGETFRSFTTTPVHPSPHDTPLRKAGLPSEPALSAALAAAKRQRELHLNIARLYSHTQLMGFFIFFALPVAYETLSSASALSPRFSIDAKDAFLATLHIIHHVGKQYPVLRYAALGIEQAAVKLGLVLTGEAELIFADIKRSIAMHKDRETTRSEWVVVFNTADSNVQKSGLDSLVKELDKLGIVN
ncbi:hypothetical protein LTR86_010966 [Recurvomyces mirabilis]|nr:hypothetical protein LTR86_010966 [Recurvomyces mirabilis]